MKVLLESWRKYLTEAELRYSESAFDKIFSAGVAVYKHDMRKPQYMKVDLPSDELYYLDNNKIRNGLVLVNFANVQGQDISKLPALPAQWDENAKTFKEDFIKNFTAHPYKLDVEFDSKFEKMGRSRIMLIGKKPVFSIKINPWKHLQPGRTRRGKRLLDADQLKNTVRHELQHMTQRLNGLALGYGEQLGASNGDFTQLKMIPLEDAKVFGVGKDPTGLRQVGSKRATEMGLSDAETIKRYLGDDFEYETWKSDIITDFVKWLLSKGHVKKSALTIASFKETHSNILSEEGQRGTEARKDIIKKAKALDLTPKEFVRAMKGRPSFNQIAVKHAKALFAKAGDPPRVSRSVVLRSFAKDIGIPDYIKAVALLAKLRPEEFVSDFVKDLEARLKKAAA